MRTAFLGACALLALHFVLTSCATHKMLTGQAATDAMLRDYQASQQRPH